MKHLDSYENIKLELNILTERLKIIKEYEVKIAKEKEEISILISMQQNIIEQIEKDISNLSGIENKLYKEIVINGTSISKAIEKVAYEEDKDVSTIWKNYYPNVKKRIDKLSNKKLEEKKEVI